MNQIFSRIFIPQWMLLEKPVRDQLAKDFNIPQSGIIEIRNEEVLTDGKTNQDLEAITKEKLVEYCKQDGEFSFLFNIAVKKAKFRAGGITISKNDIIVMDKPYCETCPAKSGRHKKGCPKFK